MSEHAGFLAVSLDAEFLEIQRQGERKIRQVSASGGFDIFEHREGAACANLNIGDVQSFFVSLFKWEGE